MHTIRQARKERDKYRTISLPCYPDQTQRRAIRCCVRCLPIRRKAAQRVLRRGQRLHPERPANESQVGISRFQVRKKATRNQTAERSKIETAVGQRGVQYEIRSAPVCLDKQLPRRSRYAGTCWQKPSCRPCKAFLRNAFCP